MPRCISAFALLLLMPIVASPLFAQTAVFGPKSYALQPSSPQAFHDAVVLDPSFCDAKASFVLRIQNGGGHGSGFISSAIVTWNGRTVADERDFNGGTSALFERALPTVNPINNLMVQLKGGSRGAALTISVIRYVDLPVFGPREYAATTSGTHYDGNFTSAMTNLRTWLVVRNGDGSGQHAVRHGRVSLNGIAVISNFDSGLDVIRQEVSLQPSNSIAIECGGDETAYLTVSVVQAGDETLCGPKVFFDTPAPGSAVYGTNVVVRGTATGARDVGVTVNGIRGVVDIEPSGTPSDPFRWCAIVPGTNGPQTLQAVVTSGSGATGQASETITFYATPNGLKFAVAPQGGMAPLHATFQLLVPDPTTVSRYEFDLDGDGQFERNSTSLPDDISFDYSVPGLYIASARVTYASGAQALTSIPVNVQSLAAMNGVLTKTWSTFLARLTSGDIDSALQLMADDATRERYRTTLTLIRSSLPTFASGITGFFPEHLGATTAHYLATRVENGRTVGYHVYFAISPDGVWRLLQF